MTRRDVPKTPSPTLKISVIVPFAVGSRVRKIAFESRISKGSVVEISLEMLFARMTDANIGEFLRSRGASLRRETVLLKDRRRS